MKLVVVVNSKVDVAVQTNAIGHLCIGMRELTNIEQLRMRGFYDSDKTLVSALTDLPLIVMSARNDTHLKEAHHDALEKTIPCNAFFECMRTGTADEQQAMISDRPVADQTYVGVCLLGTNESLKELTRRFSLLRS